MTVKKPIFSESEVEHYKDMVGLIINGNAERKREMDNQARLAIAQAKANMASADDETLVTFFVSIAVLMAHLMATPLKSIAEIMEATFDGYTIAAAHLVGSYDIDGDEIPVRRERPKDEYAASPNGPADDRNTGLYL